MANEIKTAREAVIVEAGKDLTIVSAINASAVRGDGRGGVVELKSGVSTAATLTLASDISVNGHGMDGNGGLVSIESSGQGGGRGGGGGGVIIGCHLGDVYLYAGKNISMQPESGQLYSLQEEINK